MPNTPGQVCYEAYCAAMDATLLWPSDRWHRLAQITQAAWEAAAQAVLARRETPPQPREEDHGG